MLVAEFFSLKGAKKFYFCLGQCLHHCLKSAIYINNSNDSVNGSWEKQQKSWQLFSLLSIVLVLFASSCATNLYLGPGELLLKGEPTFSKSKIAKSDSTEKFRLENLKEIGLSTVDPDLLYSSVKTHPNRRMVIPKTYLNLYNLGRSLQRYEYPPERILRFFAPKNHLVDSLASFLVRTAGEPPVLVDTAQLRLDVENLKNVYFSQGFFHAKIYPRIDTCTASVNDNKANVTFLIEEGKAFIIDKVRYEIEDDDVRKVLYKNMDETFLRSGDNYIENNMVAERSRIATVMRNNGYYTFSPQLVSFDVDTIPPDTLGTLPTNLAVKEYSPLWITIKIPKTQPVWHVGRLSMIIEPDRYDPEVDNVMLAMMPGMMNDSVRKVWHLARAHYSDSSKVTFITYERILERMNFNFLEELIFLTPGAEYELGDERKTQARLQNLGIFKYVLLKPTLDEESYTVDFTIQTVLLPRFQLKAGFEGFFENDPILKSNLPGIGGEIGYRDKLLFKGAEKLDVSAKGNVRFFHIGDAATFRIFWEGSGTANLKFPRLVAPVFLGKNIQGYEPSTNLTTTYARQQSAGYVRNSSTLDWNYRFFHSTIRRRSQSSISPYVINLIQSSLGQEFVDLIKGIENDALRTLIIQDYRPRFSSWGNYKFTFNNQSGRKLKPYLSLIANAQMGGNTPYLIDRFAKLDDSYKDYRIANVFYGQYLKASCDLRNYLPVSKHAMFVFRNFLGIARPWNYTPFVPFESRFFAGGTNGMRGWQSNTLGPGTYQTVNTSNVDQGLNFFVSPGGEFVFENNFEFRTDVYKWIKLAIFADVGNVWFLPGSTVDFPGSKLSKSTILQMGLDAGLGFRFDFDFFIFRIDLAQQVYAPDIQQFVIKSFPKSLGGNRFQLNFGIGYPF